MAHSSSQGKRDKDRPSVAPTGPGSSSGSSSSLAGAEILEPVAPLEVSANRWTPASLTKKGQHIDSESPEVVDKKVRSLLNRLTMERFDSISDQIISWANRSEKEKDGRTLVRVIRLVFEKATDEAAGSAMYARLCRKMMEQISPNVHDDGIKNADGKPIAGGQLFLKHLLNRCQEEFERGWVQKEATAAAAATKASQDQAAKGENKDEESALYSEEYYATQKAKRRGLSLIKFICELFKLQMLTERIMHECVKKLLGNVENPEEEEIESLCKLLTTVGQILDTPKARAHMDVYFSRMKELTKSPNVNSRMQFMLQDVIELRERKWIPRNQMAAPMTIAAIHEQAAKEKLAQEKEAFTRQISMSRGGSRRGGDRGDHAQVGPDGWAVAGGAAPRPPPKAGDLSKFGKIDKSAPMTFGPSSVFQKGDKSKSRESTIRQGSQNMFSMLSGNPEMAAEVAGKSSRPPSRKSSIDLGPGGVPDGAAPPQRKRLQLLPRSVPLDAKSESTPAASTVGSEDDGRPSLVEADTKKRIDEDLKEFFSIRDLSEAEVYFTKLPSKHRHLLVDKLVTRAVESKQADAQLVADLFERAVWWNLCSPASFEEGFMPTAEVIDDIVIDAPKAMDLFAIMIKGWHLHLDEARWTRLVSKSKDAPKLAQALIGCTSSRRMFQASTDLSACSYPGLAIKSGLATITTGPSHTTSIDFNTSVSSPMGIASSDWVHTGIQHPTELHSTSKLPQQAAIGIIEDVVGEFDTQPTFSPVDSLSSPIQSRMSRRTADEHIERSATLLSGLHDVGAGLAMFRDLPTCYHGRLVDRLVSGAMEPGTNSMRAQVLAYLFHWAAERNLCSTAAFEEGISMTTSALKDTAAEVPDAFERYAVIVRGMGLHTDSGWRARILDSLETMDPSS